MHNHILPQWTEAQAREEMDRRLFERNLQLANEQTHKALHGPFIGRAVARYMAHVYLSRAMAFCRGGGE